jgi:hypothetical protein
MFKPYNHLCTTQSCKDFIQASKTRSEVLFKHCSCYSSTRGVTSSYITTLPDDHHVPWGEFRTAFCAHNLCAGLLHSKLKEFLDLEQGNRSVFDYMR